MSHLIKTGIAAAAFSVASIAAMPPTPPSQFHLGHHPPMA